MSVPSIKISKAISSLIATGNPNFTVIVEWIEQLEDEASKREYKEYDEIALRQLQGRRQLLNELLFEIRNCNERLKR